MVWKEGMGYGADGYAQKLRFEQLSSTIRLAGYGVAKTH